VIVPGIPFGPELVLILIVVAPIAIAMYVCYRVVKWIGD